MLSRVAESIYWINRYVERAENVARFVHVNLHLELDVPVLDDASNALASAQWQPLIWTTGDEKIFVANYPEFSRENVIKFLTFDDNNPNSILSCVTRARENARQVRGCIDLEAWEHLNRFYHMLGSADARRRAAESPYDFYSEIRQASYLFEGIAEATMSRGEEWHFLKLGRYLERADQTSRILDVKYFILLPDPADVGSVVDDLLWGALLRSVSGYEMFRRRHGRILPDKVVEFLVLDREFPRAVLASLLRAEESLLAVSGTPMGSFRNDAERRLSRLRSGIAYASVQEIIAQGLHEFLDGLQTGLLEAGDAISATFFALEAASAAQSQQ